MSNIVTIFKDITTTSAGFHRDVFYVLDRIKNGDSKEKLSLIRLEKDKQKRQKLKMGLPSICFSGTFSNRSISGLKRHSGLICLDFDGFEEEDTLTLWRDKLEAWEYSLAVFLSPSGNGLKVLVKIPAEEKNHKAYFEAISNYFKSSYFDDTTSDVSRVCYESYDPDIYINKDSLVWLDKMEKDDKTLGDIDILIPMVSSSRKMDRLVTWWERKFGSNKGSRNTNLFKLAMAFNDYGIDQTEAEQFMSRYRADDFSDREIKGIIKSAYANRGNFGVKQFNDDVLQEKTEKLIRAGKSLKGIKEEIHQIDAGQIEYAVEQIKETMAVTEFWHYTPHGKIKLLPHKYKYFLEQNQFFKFYPEGSENFVFVQIEANLLVDTNRDHIKDFVLKWLEENPDTYQAWNMMADNPKYFKDDYLSMIKTTDVKLKSDTEDKCYLYYRNCAIEVGINSIKKIDYLELDGFIWKKHIIDRDYKHKTKKESEFERFLFLAAGKDKQKFFSLMSVAGYLMHSHKTSSNNRAIIFNDETVSENPNGGSGKGLFCKAISHMKRTAIIDGKNFSFDKSFPYQTVGADAQALVFDDVKKNFVFENLFSLITEGITLEKKNKDAIHIPVSKSPKIVITTNYTIGGVGGSHDRRKFEVEMSSYFGSNYTPIDEFGHQLFDDWDEDEWQRFDTFMIQCVQYYLENGLVKHSFNNLELRKFIKETSSEFAEWTGELDGKRNADNIPINVRINKKQAYESFTEEHQDLKKWLTQRTFTRWVEIYARKNGYDVKQGKSHYRWIELIPAGVKDEEDDLEF